MITDKEIRKKEVKGYWRGFRAGMLNIILILAIVEAVVYFCVR